MTRGLTGRRRESWRRAIAWIFLSLCGFGAVGVTLWLGFVTA